MKQHRTAESTATAAMAFKMPTISLADGQDCIIGIERKNQRLLGHLGRACACGRRREQASQAEIAALHRPAFPHDSYSVLFLFLFERCLFPFLTSSCIFLQC